MIGLFCTPALAEEGDLHKLRLGEHSIAVEVVETAQARQQGLMYREYLPDNQGMLFVFEAPKTVCFWMKDTLIPLSVAFLTDDGRIVGIADMQPKSETLHCSPRAVRLALEMNQGWFERNNTQPNDRVEGLDAIRTLRP
ncbi:DUF192 domain-containing protein [Pseudomonas duriflava]|uniref:DUF192 domain-containing protein n=1 Tax=Pseudomonas duriflava TaxID=459528 RepID=UPI001ABF0C21|nr:DUF192 domain-containing protein [Pseudomonas duriflava]